MRPLPRVAVVLLLAVAGCGGGSPSDSPIDFVRYQSDSGGSGFDLSARRDAAIVLQGFWRQDEIAAIRDANPDCRILVYQNISRTAIPDAEGRYNSAITRAEAQERGWASGVPDNPDSWLELVKPNDAGGYGRFALERMLSKLEESEAAGRRVDGVFLDDDNSFAPEVQGGDPTTSPEQWDQWMEDVNRIVGPGLRARGYQVMANLSGAMAQRNLESGGWEERQFEHFDYVFDEFTAHWQDGAPQPQRYVDEAFRLAGAARAAGTTFVASVPDGGDEAKAAFGLGMVLIQDPAHAAKAPGRGDAEPWFPVYDRARKLGKPVGEPRETGPGIWTREFEHGSVKLDLGARTAEIDD
jgi:putative glycosyl hydrolase-like family 15 (GHL15) protein